MEDIFKGSWNDPSTNMNRIACLLDRIIDIEQVLSEKGCPEHPRYQGKGKPRSNCSLCRILYRTLHRK